MTPSTTRISAAQITQSKNNRPVVSIWPPRCSWSSAASSSDIHVSTAVMPHQWRCQGGRAAAIDHATSAQPSSRLDENHVGTLASSLSHRLGSNASITASWERECQTSTARPTAETTAVPANSRRRSAAASTTGRLYRTVGYEITAALRSRAMRTAIAITVMSLAACGGSKKEAPPPPPVVAKKEEKPAEPPPPPEPEKPKHMAAKAARKAIKGSKVEPGTVTFQQDEGGDTKVVSEFSGLKAGTYDLVIHDGSECGDDGKKAGGPWKGGEAVKLTF